jgi:hypothetical protein
LIGGANIGLTSLFYRIAFFVAREGLWSCAISLG